MNDTAQPPALTRLTIARWTVLVATLVLSGLFCAGLVVFVRDATSLPHYVLPRQEWTSADLRNALSQLELPLEIYLSILIGRDVIWTGLCLGLAGMFWWRKRDGFGLYLAGMIALYGIATGTPVTALGSVWSPAASLGQLLAGPAWLSFFLLFYVFPDGNFAPRWLGWVLPVWVLAVGYAALMFSMQWSPVPVMAFLVAFLLIGIGSQIYRYIKISSQAQRQQTKWVLATFGLRVVHQLLGLLNNLANGSASFGAGPTNLILNIIITNSSYLIGGLTFIAVAIAILRYRLFDIDLIIRRTVLWAIISGLGLGVYLLAVGTTSFFLGSQPDYVIPLVALILVAIIARPLYRRLETLMDRIVPVSAPVPNSEDE